MIIQVLPEDEQLIANSDHPHRHVGPEAAVATAGGRLELFGPAGAVKVLAAPTALSVWLGARHPPASLRSGGGTPRPRLTAPGPKPDLRGRAAAASTACAQDRLDRAGKVTLRYAGRLRHIGVGRAHAGATVLLLVAARDVRVATDTGQLLGRTVIDPARTTSLSAIGRRHRSSMYRHTQGGRGGT